MRWHTEKDYAESNQGSPFLYRNKDDVTTKALFSGVPTLACRIGTIKVTPSARLPTHETEAIAAVTRHPSAIELVLDKDCTPGTLSDTGAPVVNDPVALKVLLGRYTENK